MQEEKIHVRLSEVSMSGSPSQLHFNVNTPDTNTQEKLLQSSERKIWGENETEREKNCIETFVKSIPISYVQ